MHYMLDNAWNSTSFAKLPSLCPSPFFFLQSPPKGATIPYRPKAASTPVIFSGGQVRAELALQHRCQSLPETNTRLLLQHQLQHASASVLTLSHFVCHRIPFTNEPIIVRKITLSGFFFLFNQQNVLCFPFTNKSISPLSAAKVQVGQRYYTGQVWCRIQ